MAEIIEEPSALSKIIPISFKINDTDSVTTTRLATKKQFNTTDTDAWLSFTLDGIETTSGEFDLTLINVDENPSSIFHHTSIAFPGIPFHYKLDASEDLMKNEIRHAGRWIGQVIIRLANGDATTRQFDFAIAGHLLDGKEARVILIEDYNALIATITASKTELEGYNIDYAALIADVDAKEALREQAEIDRAATFDALVESEMIAQNVATKLAEKEATFAPRMLSLESELADKITKGQASVTDINKNLGKLDQTYMTDEFLQQMAGTTPVNAIPAKESITMDKLAFGKVGTNLFNKNDVDIANEQYIITSTGQLGSSTTFITSGYIKVTPLTQYILKFVERYAYYDASKVFVSGSGVATVSPFTNILTTAPATAVYLRISWKLASLSLDVQQVNTGNVLLPYENYKLIIAKEYLEDKPFDVNNIPEGGILRNKTDFAILGKNLVDLSKVTPDKFINNTDGTLAGSTNYYASDFIEVIAGESYTQSHAKHFAFYDIGKNYISGLGLGNPSGDPRTTIVPINAKYIRLSISKLESTAFQFEKGASSTYYEPFGYRFSRELPNSNNFRPEFNLPSKLYALVGQEFNIYLDNILNDKDTRYDFKVSCQYGGQFENMYRITPTVAGTFPMTIKAYKDLIEVATVTSSLVVTSASVGNGVSKKLLIIGDSTTATVGGMVVQKLHTDFESDVMDITTIGTKGTAPWNHEAISGWTTEQMVSDPTSVFVFSGVFNFGQYMTTQGYSGLNYVIINLGINDMFEFTDDVALSAKITTTLAQYQTMIDSIKSYDSNIKIGIALTIPPAYSQDAFGQYAGGNVRWRYKRNHFLWVKALIATFKDKEGQGVYLIPIHTNLDTRHNMGTEQVAVNARNSTLITRTLANGRVHPVDSGYWQIADVYWYWLKSFEV